MTFTYSGDPSATDRDAVRFLLQDTVSPGEISDEEIAYLLTTYGTPIEAAIGGARALFSKYAKLVTRQVGDLRIAYSDRATQWKALLAVLETQTLTLSPGGFYVGGQSQSEQDADDQDTNLPQPRFRVGVHDEWPEMDNEDLARIWGFF